MFSRYMLSSFCSKSFYLINSSFYFFVFLFFLDSFNFVQALPCYPTDPTGLNPDNLCLLYPNPSINPNAFVQGEFRPIRALPDISVPAGRVLIQPRGGYWTEIRTQDGGRQIQTSGGERFNIPK